jgi:hypothetical protein
MKKKKKKKKIGEQANAIAITGSRRTEQHH